MAKGQRISIRQVISTTARNLGLENPSQHLNSFIEWAMEAEMKIGSKDTYVLKERTYKGTNTTTNPTATITFNTQPLTGDWFSINGYKIYWVGTVQEGEREIDNDSSLSNAMTNLNTYLTTPSISAQTTVGGLVNKELTGLTYGVNTSTGVLTITYADDGTEGNHLLLDGEGDITLTGNRLDGGADRIHNNRILLPSDFYKIHDLKVDSQFAEPTIASFPSGANKENRYYIQGKYLYVTTGESDFEVASADIDEIVMSYFGFEFDIDGFPTISAGHADAVSHYLMYKLRSIDYYNGKLPRYLWMDMKMEWDRLCGQARGKDNMPSAHELRKIGKIWGSLVPVVDKLGKKWL